MGKQILPDGSMPRELGRTRPLHYSFYALEAFAQLATVGARVGEDLWHYETADHRSLTKAIDYVLPCVTQGGTCPFKAEGPGVEPFRSENAIRVLMYADAGLAGRYTKSIAALEATLGSPLSDPRTLCLKDRSRPPSVASTLPPDHAVSAGGSQLIGH